MEDSGERLVVRTKVQALWLGLPALAVFVAIVGGGLWQSVRAVLALQIVAAVASITGLAAGGAFMALFLIGFLNQRLVATREAVEVISKFGPVAWKRRRFVESAEITCITNANAEGDSYELEVRASDGFVRFGSESNEQNIEMLAQRLCQVCMMCRVAAQPLPHESQPPKMIPAKTVRRQQKKGG